MLNSIFRSVTLKKKMVTTHFRPRGEQGDEDGPIDRAVLRGAEEEHFGFFTTGGDGEAGHFLGGNSGGDFCGNGEIGTGPGDRVCGATADALAEAADRIDHADAELKAVELGFRLRMGALHFDGILRRQHHERRVQGVGLTADGDLAFLHRLQQRSLFLWNPQPRLEFLVGPAHFLFLPRLGDFPRETLASRKMASL